MQLMNFLALSCRGSSIKTRIETFSYPQNFFEDKLCCRGSSIKTRIETHIHPLQCLFPLCCRGSSIKTRIETVIHILHTCWLYAVAEVVPLKQGLKHNARDAIVKKACGCRGSSIKTRIKTSSFLLV